MENELDAYLGVINRFIAYHGHRAVKNTQHDTSKAYPFIAMDTRQVFEQISFVHGHLDMEGKNAAQTFRFLDVGCGIGNILLVAEQYGFDVYGLEKDAYPCSLAKELIGKERIWQEDAFAFNRYNDFDVVYFFRLLPDAEPQARLEKMIEERIKPGAILIANRRLGTSIEADKRFKQLYPAYPIWQKCT